MVFGTSTIFVMKLDFESESIRIKHRFRIRLWGLFRNPSPSPSQRITPPVEAVATGTRILPQFIFCHSIDKAHNSRISSTFQKADCLGK